MVNRSAAGRVVHTYWAARPFFMRGSNIVAWDGQEQRKTGDGCVDPDVQLAINEGNDEVKRSITEAFKDALRDAVDNIINHIDLVTSPLKDDVKRLRGDVSDLYDKDRDMRDRVGKMEARQAMGEGKDAGEDRAGEAHARQYNMSIGKITLLLGLATALGGGAAWLITSL